MRTGIKWDSSESDPIGCLKTKARVVIGVFNNQINGGFDFKIAGACVNYWGVIFYQLH